MEPKSLLLIEDEHSFANVLCRRLQKQGFETHHAAEVNQGLELARAIKPDYLILDMKVGETNSISVIPELRALLPHSRIILLTGYASIATAVDAIKQGADDYLAKPVDMKTLIPTLLGEIATADEQAEEETLLTPARLEWEQLQQVLKVNEGNVSATARQLGMHRRTLQRKLAKKPQN